LRRVEDEFASSTADAGLLPMKLQVGIRFKSANMPNSSWPKSLLFSFAECLSQFGGHNREQPAGRERKNSSCDALLPNARRSCAKHQCSEHLEHVLFSRF